MINITSTSSQMGFPAMPGTRLCNMNKYMKETLFNFY